MTNKSVLTLVAIASLLAIAAVFVFRPLPTTITRENAARLRVGMTVAEVVTILGDPRDEVTSPPLPKASSYPPISTTISPYAPAGLVSPPPRDRRRWVGETLVITVDSNPDRVVVAVNVSDHEFGSTWQFAWWRVRRVLGLSPDVPTAIEKDFDPSTLVIY